MYILHNIYYIYIYSVYICREKPSNINVIKTYNTNNNHAYLHSAIWGNVT